MKWLYLFSVFIVITISCNALICSDAEISFVVSLKNFSLDEFISLINLRVSTNGHKKCLVDIQVNYAQKILIVLFGSGISSSSLTTNRQIYMDTYLALAQDDIYLKSHNVIINHVQFACNTNDCNHQFLLRHLEWLVKMEYNDLVSNISPLLIKKNEIIDRCVSGKQNKIQSCPNGLCYLEYSMSTDKTKYDCESGSDMQPALHLVTYFTAQDYKYQERMAKVNFTISYWCRSDGCNDEAMAKQVIRVVEENYNLFEMQDMLHTANIEYWIEEESKLDK
ncbi:unnamed protein product [Rotaria socialis]|uniref:Uncharacterized protein n=2 Tax=Rotaria socialis TaxID=392032 RepID=A0A821NHE5_9BILA|nr:unnamed protein product [Rotaria socialis]CAF4786302.1 unnamed protein product [Rotaria socialis]